MWTGWIKLHRKFLDNKVWKHHPTAWRIFEALLAICDENGRWSGGRFQLAKLVNISPSAAYRGIVRLELEGQIETKPNNKWTDIQICKWEEYQHKPNNNRTTNEQQTDTLIRIENKELRNNTLVEIQRIYDLYLKEFESNPNQYKLTPKRKLKIQARLKDAGSELLGRAIENTARSAFHRGENDRSWKADLDFIVRSYEQVEKLANGITVGKLKARDGTPMDSIEELKRYEAYQDQLAEEGKGYAADA